MNFDSKSSSKLPRQIWITFLEHLIHALLHRYLFWYVDMTTYFFCFHIIFCNWKKWAKMIHKSWQYQQHTSDLPIQIECHKDTNYITNSGIVFVSEPIFSIGLNSCIFKSYRGFIFLNERILKFIHELQWRFILMSKRQNGLYSVYHQIFSFTSHISDFNYIARLVTCIFVC